MDIYTHSRTARIVELFEEILDQYNISIPSPDDDDRDTETDAKLYGRAYGDLFDAVEDELIDILDEHDADNEVVIGWG